MNIDDFCMGCMGNKKEAVVCPECGWRDGMQSETQHYLPLRTIVNDRYLIGKVLGQGGFGIVYVAGDMDTAMRVAIKEYFPRELASRAQDHITVTPYEGDAEIHFKYGLDKFLEEAKVLAQFRDHPGIVSVNEFFTANNTAYMSMQYIDGMTLKEFLQQQGNKITFKRAVGIMMPVMDALKEIHGIGLVHRDISPDNIYITKDNQVKLLDFGAARYAIGEYSKSISVILKQGYAPEEQYRTRGKQGPWTDVYAVAATIFKAVTGETPPDALDRLEHDTVKKTLLACEELSVKERVILMKGLTVNAINRYRTVKEFQAALIGEGYAPEPTATVTGAALADKAAKRTHTAISPTISSSEKKTEKVASDALYCSKHPHSKAVWQCTECGKLYCNELNCVNTRHSSIGTVATCPQCKEPCIEIAEDKVARKSELLHPQRSVIGTLIERFWWTLGLIPAALLLWIVLTNYWTVPEKNLADRALVAYDQKHYSEAFDLFNKAAESGNINAEYYLGIMYENGYGVKQDRSNALMWYSKAASHGHPLAGPAIERMQNVLNAP